MNDPADDLAACQLCGSTRFHVDDGLTFCVNGHDQHRGPAAEADEADWATTRGGKLHRDTVKDAKGKKKGKQSRVPRGRGAAEEWAKGMGLVCWKVCWALGRLTGSVVPSESERDERVGGDEGSGSDTETAGKMADELWGVVRGLWALRLGELVATWDAAETDVLEDTDVTDTEDLTDATDAEHEAKDKASKKSRFLHRAPKLVDTIALNYLALVLMRYPIPLSSIYTWVQIEALPHMRAIRHLPPAIKDRLPPEYHLSFDTTSTLQPEDLQLAIYRNAKHCTTTFGMTFPPLNWRPLLLRWVETLALPLQVYAMVKNLNTICDFSFGYCDGTLSGRRNANSYPEAQLMALLVVATKLLFPFDAATVKRHPRSTTEHGLIRVDWQRWLEAKKWFERAQEEEERKQTPLRPGREMEIDEQEIMRMEGHELDAYMDWYQDMWMSAKVEDEAVGVQKELLGMFPVEKVHVRDKVEEARKREVRLEALRKERLRMVLGGLKSRRVVTEAQVEEAEREQEEATMRTMLRPGMGYQVFQDEEDLEGVPRAFHQEAASAASLSLKTLVRAVVIVENRIDRWRREKKRADALGDEEAMDLDPPPEYEVVA